MTFFLTAIILAAGFAEDQRESEWLAKANALFAAGKLQESRAAVDEALRADPKLAPALLLKARLSMAVRDHPGARKALLAAVEAAPASWYAHFLLGFQYYLESELQLALPPLEKARRLDPKESRPALYLGLVNESLGDPERALRHYRDAIALETASGKLQAETLLTPARLLLMMNRLDECSMLLNRAMRIEPDLRDVHHERARLFMKRGDAAAAAAAGERALQLPAGAIADHQIRYVLVRAYGLMGDEKRAAEHAAALRNNGR